MTNKKNDNQKKSTALDKKALIEKKSSEYESQGFRIRYSDGSTYVSPDKD